MEHYRILENNRHTPNPLDFAKKKQNAYQKGLKARPMSAQGERSEPWDCSMNDVR